MARPLGQARRVAAALSLVAGGATAAPAQNVVWWVDYHVWTSVVPGALARLQALRPGVTVTAAPDQATFNALLAGGGYDLAVFGEQDSQLFPGSEAQLTDFLADGGRILAASLNWNHTTSPFFGATRVTTNEGVVSGTGPLFAGIASPVLVFNSGWGMYTYSVSYAGPGPCLATWEGGGCAAIVGNGGRTMLLGPLFDTYADVAQGERFVANAADYLLGAQAVPEPTTAALLAGALLVLAGAARRARAPR